MVSSKGLETELLPRKTDVCLFYGGQIVCILAIANLLIDLTMMVLMN